MNKSIGQINAVCIIERILEEYYHFGRTELFSKYMADFVIGFGAQSMQFFRGKQEILAFLEKEYQLISPCNIINKKIREKKDDNGPAVDAQLVLSSMKNDTEMYILHRVVVTYDLSDKGFVINGVYVTRNMRHEGTYKKLREKLFHDRVRDQLVEKQQMDIFSSSMESVAVTYLLNSTKILSMQEENGSIAHMLGYESLEKFEQAVEGCLWTVVYQEDIKRLQKELTGQILKGNYYKLEYRMVKADGSILWVLENGTKSFDNEGNVVLNAMITDITQLRQVRKNLGYRASYDALTGIYNRETFYSKAQKLIQLNPDVDFAILRMDIERFKVINDLFGEKVGDKLLKYIANIYSNVNLPLCVSGRLHSDNFVVLFKYTEETCKHFIESLQVMASSFSLDYRVVLNFGLYRIKDEDRDKPVSVMSDRAGLALKKAKGNYLVLYGEYDDDMRQDLVAEQAIVNEMGKALQQREFVLYLQPKYELANETIIGAEVLVRWQNAQRGFVSPGEFIPIFEHNGFIFNLDQYVWEESCRLLRKWLDEGRSPLPVSVNVSRVSMCSENLVGIFKNLIKKYNLPKHLLELEITESAYIDNPEYIIEVTKALQREGFVILMDDFGSGYSSLNMLKNLPVDVLKIDLKFLDSVDSSGRGGNILNSVVRMAQWLDIPVIAEGVETRNQVDFLKSIGCNWVQGFYYSKPVPVHEYEDRVAECN